MMSSEMNGKMDGKKINLGIFGQYQITMNKPVIKILIG